MKERVKDLWVEALLSGDYDQGRGYLRSDKGFCCLGVLCDLAVEEGVGTWGKPGDVEVTTDRTARAFEPKDSESSAWDLPPAVLEWAGIKTKTGLIFDTSLADENDRGASFFDIAFVIEGNWKEL